MRLAAVPTIVAKLAGSFVAAAILVYAIDLWHQTQDRLTDGAGRPFGDDFVNYWSGGFLALHGRAVEVYDLGAFHAFEQSVAGMAIGSFHYSYPPVMMLLSAPFALIPYVPSLFVWLTAGWYAFYRALKLAMPARHVLLLALASPAVLINAVGGQNGCWTAALLGGGLGLLERRPYVAGMLFGTMIYKPHLALLVPVALAAGRQWRAFIAAALAVGGLVLVSFILFGADVWSEYLRNLTMLRRVILEEGTGVWHRFVSVFVSARRLGASVEVAYIIQLISGTLALISVAWVWFRDAPAAIKNAILILGTCLSTPYLQDYDLVFGAIVVAWLWQQPVENERAERALQIGCGLILMLPLVAAALGRLTGISFGPLFILPLFATALRISFRSHDAAVGAPARLSSVQS